MENIKQHIGKQLYYYERLTDARRDKDLEREQMENLLQKQNKITFRTPKGGTRITTKYVKKDDYKKIEFKYRYTKPHEKYRVLFNKQVFTFATKEQFFLWLYRRAQTLMKLDPTFGELFHSSVCYVERVQNRDSSEPYESKVNDNGEE